MSDAPGLSAGIRATYRLQFHKAFTFRDATGLVPYLAKLGISHMYASPIMQARPGSTHGYDIVNHGRLNPEIGTDEDFASLVAALKAHGMGLILDIVPNHMGVGAADNPWWLDVLEWGETSPFANYFDINWDPIRDDTKDCVLLPVLGGQYGTVLEKGEVELKFDPAEGSFSAWYYSHRFPISPHSYAGILNYGGEPVARFAGEFGKLRRLGPEAARARAMELKRELSEAATDEGVAAAINAATAAFTGTPGRAATYRRLHRLLEAQSYRLADWHVAAEEINYRRFFNINDLAGLRIELPELFEVAHRVIFAMVERGDVQGLRIDHIDGLFDPAVYCATLRQRTGEATYITVEKILAHYEHLPEWPIAGSTGYDFVNQALALFVDPGAEAAMTRLYRRLTGRAENYDDVLYASKRRIMHVNLASELNVLARRFHRLSMADWRYRDFTFNGMLGALQEVIAGFPVYRTYVSERGASADDRRYIEWAIAQAKKHWLAGDTSIFAFINGVLLADLPGHPHPADVLRVAMQFQQVTGPVMAKSFEDTAFYRYFRLLALNEVGGDPRRFGMSPAAFHRIAGERARQWPHAMLTTSTHDTKRGEDARLRIAMLSEMPQEWGRHVTHWLRLNRRLRSEIDGEEAPDRNIEYMFYQLLVGVWPVGLDPTDAEALAALAERVEAAMIKSVREGKEKSGWTWPNEPFEAALQRFVRGALDASRANPFLTDFAAFIAGFERPSAISSLAQVVLKLTVPGVCDIYQGGELWDFSLVDPDNRRPVDWQQRHTLLEQIGNAYPTDLSAAWQDGREKLFVTARLLDLRRSHAELFASADYQPLDVGDGANSDRLCAYARRLNGTAVAVVVPRLTYGLFGKSATADFGEADVVLPGEASWRNIFTGATMSGATAPATELLREFPVAVLLGEGLG